VKVIEKDRPELVHEPMSPAESSTVPSAITTIVPIAWACVPVIFPWILYLPTKLTETVGPDEWKREQRERGGYPPEREAGRGGRAPLRRRRDDQQSDKSKVEDRRSRVVKTL